MSIRFAEFELDEGRRQLLRDKVVVALPPKGLSLLQLLIERAPNAISKQELFDRLWPNTFVSAVNLPSVIADLRAALQDDARNPRFIRTVHGFGYAFCGEISTAPSKAADVEAVLFHDRREINLHRGENVLGRDPSLPCSIEHHSVSRRHAVITCADDGVSIRDLDSKNGTEVGGTPVSGDVRLSDGDRIRLGSAELVFREMKRDRATLTVTRAGNKKPTNS